MRARAVRYARNHPCRSRRAIRIDARLEERDRGAEFAGARQECARNQLQFRVYSCGRGAEIPEQLAHLSPHVLVSTLRGLHPDRHDPGPRRIWKLAQRPRVPRLGRRIVPQQGVAQHQSKIGPCGAGQCFPFYQRIDLHQTAAGLVDATQSAVDHETRPWLLELPFEEANGPIDLTSLVQCARQVCDDRRMQRVDERGTLEDCARLVDPPLLLHRACSQFSASLMFGSCSSTSRSTRSAPAGSRGSPSSGEIPRLPARAAASVSVAGRVAPTPARDRWPGLSRSPGRSRARHGPRRIPGPSRPPVAVPRAPIASRPCSRARPAR